MAQSSTKLKRSVSAKTHVEAEGSTYKLSGTLGQNATGLSAKEQVKISSGYWGWIARWGVLGTDDELDPRTASVMSKGTSTESNLYSKIQGNIDKEEYKKIMQERLNNMFRPAIPVIIDSIRVKNEE